LSAKTKNSSQTVNFSQTEKELLQLILNDPTVNAAGLKKSLGKSLSTIMGQAVDLIKTTPPKHGKVKIANITEKFKKQSIIFIHNQDKPFLVDSITNLLNSEGLSIAHVLHPVFSRVQQPNKAPTLQNPSNDNKNNNESLIIIILDEALSKEQQQNLVMRVEDILTQVDLAVSDWQLMIQNMTRARQEIDFGKKNFKTPTIDEIKKLFKWFEEGHFTYLGFQEYSFENNKTAVKKSLGITKSQGHCYFKTNCQLDNPGQDFLPATEPFIITKTISRSPVHRSTPMDVIRLNKFDTNGKVVGAYQFIGLLTASAYNISITKIPLLSQKLEHLLSSCRAHKNTHTYKAIIHILENLPRDELFQFSRKDLLSLVEQILQLQDRNQTLTYIRPDPLGHLIAAYVYVPTNKYSAALRQKIQNILEQKLNAQVNAYNPNINPDTSYARISFSLAKDFEQKLKFNLTELQESIEDASLSWEGKFRDLLKSKNENYRSFSNAFPKSYQLKNSPTQAIKDLEKCLQALSDQDKIIYVQPPKNNAFLVKVYYPGPLIALSELVTVFELMGLTILSEVNFQIKDDQVADVCTIHGFNIAIPEQLENITAEHLINIEQGIQSISRNYYENDFLNSLIFYANMTVSHVGVFRAYCKYLKQVGFPYSFRLISSVLNKNIHLTRLLWLLFEQRFSSSTTETKIKKSHEKIIHELKKLKSIEEDTIFRNFSTLIMATLRTNYFIRSNETSPIIFKLNSSAVSFLPEPKPNLEFFVYHKDFEGVHLRTGKVARGGMRWSDRVEDFRIEILGLMKAQKVKNTVIVPVGAKGGFVLKKTFSSDQDQDKKKFGIECYQQMIQAMLDITDNLVNNRLKHPKNVICHDEFDPYLVVAADKGTATFSDFANQIALENNFWLGDAFASGGSHGYDHKKMGITAKGAWKSVQHHFRKLGINVQETPISVVGIGDMSGDVFGNGMLCSNKIKLVAAFNHQHIFIDPNPNPEKSFEERQRLFKLDRSSWLDYNTKVLSEGGGIYSRNQREIILSSHAQKTLKIKKKKISPNELIQSILRSPIDLLWFGGIGTYVKSSQEANNDVNDRNNDDIRINGNDLNCRVIAEGANLGITQLGRIEFASHGGLINTDAIDNSAGVDCSDHEVNLKILLKKLVADKKITPAQRNQLLGQMENEVSELILAHNVAQNNAISMIEARGAMVLGRQQRFMHFLECENYLNRQLEFLPNADEMIEKQRNGIGLTRPEIAIILAYGKMFSYDQILASNLLKHKYFEKHLISYFPKKFHQDYSADVEKHPLKKEIMATIICNEVVNQQGPSYLTEVMSITNQCAEVVLIYYYMVRDSMDINFLTGEINQLTVSYKVQQKLNLALMKILDYCVIWTVTNSQNHKKKNFNLGRAIDDTRMKIQDLSENIHKFLDKHEIRNLEKEKKIFTKQGVPIKLAERVLMTQNLKYSWGLLDISESIGCKFLEAASTFFKIDHILDLPWLRESLENQKTNDPWRRRNITQMKKELDQFHFKLTAQAILLAKSNNGSLRQWQNQKEIQNYKSLTEELKSKPDVTIDMLVILINHLRSLTK
tara:strand:- start:15890 stop:20596 length:4707 start_codon:yes stop_codon:yes gene_type:complete